MTLLFYSLHIPKPKADAVKLHQLHLRQLSARHFSLFSTALLWFFLVGAKPPLTNVLAGPRLCKLRLFHSSAEGDHSSFTTNLVELPVSNTGQRVAPSVLAGLSMVWIWPVDGDKVVSSWRERAICSMISGRCPSPTYPCSSKGCHENDAAKEAGSMASPYI